MEYLHACAPRLCCALSARLSVPVRRTGRWKNARTGRVMAENRHNPLEAIEHGRASGSFVVLCVQQAIEGCERRRVSSVLTQSRRMPAEVSCFVIEFVCARVFCACEVIGKVALFLPSEKIARPTPRELSPLPPPPTGGRPWVRRQC